MKRFEFCPMCGRELKPVENDIAGYCDFHDRSWYRQMAPTAGCVIVQDGRALITQRARDPERDRFDVPGGFLDPGEDPIAGLKREVREELNLEIDVSIEDCLQMVPHSYGSDDSQVLAIGFKARLVSGEPSPDDDVADYKWVAEDELDGIDFAWEHDRELVRKALEHA